jgi:hypothetical protein
LSYRSRQVARKKSPDGYETCLRNLKTTCETKVALLHFIKSCQWLKMRIVSAKLPRNKKEEEEEESRELNRYKNIKQGDYG